MCVRTDALSEQHSLLEEVDFFDGSQNVPWLTLHELASSNPSEVLSFPASRIAFKCQSFPNFEGTS